MCGIAGFLTRSNRRPTSDLQAEVLKMADALSHRGPDDFGTWVDSATGIALGQRRLSIVDLSAEGHQPMLSASSRYAIVFNGEIYNYRDLQAQLLAKGHRFRGHSDTEVLLASIEEWGVPATLEAAVGMFAFALWDRSEQVLFLARDRVGEKPLYYGWTNGTLLFASELKSFRIFPGSSWEVDRDALALFFKLGYIPSPFSIYKGVCKLTPGTFVRIDRQSPGDLPSPVSYWSMRSAAETGAANPYMGADSDAVDELEALLKQSVRGQMVADVPVGAFLSGGIDSSTIVALMQAQSSRPIRTFTIGFHEAEYNEAKHAASIARHLGTSHTELYVSPAEAIAVIPRLPHIYDEPFSDSSQIPTFLVSQLARSQVTVSLSGDGGDEFFTGYQRYGLCQRIWSRMNLVPAPLRRTLARCLLGTRGARSDDSSTFLARSGSRLQPVLFDRILKAAALLSSDSADQLYWRLNSQWDLTENVVQGAGSNLAELAFLNSQIRLPNFLDRMCYADSVSYLPDDILVKVDRASMAVSLESRVPLLDHRVIEFTWRLPASLKTRHGQSKWPLRQVLYKYVPRQLIERPKMGFGVPIEHWLKGPLRDWAEDLLEPSRLQREGFLNPKPIRYRWEQHLSGKRRWHYSLWDVLMFQAWLQTQRKVSDSRPEIFQNAGAAQIGQA